MGEHMAKREIKKHRFHLWSTRFSTVLSVALVLFMLGLGILFIYHSYLFSNQVRENISFLVYFKPDTDEEEARAYSAELAKDPRVRKVDFVDKEEAAALMKNLLGDDHLDIFQGEIPYELSAIIYLNAQNINSSEIQRFIITVQAKEIVNMVDYQHGLVNQVNSAIYNASIVILVIFLCLLFIAITLIDQTVRLSIYAKRFLIHTMALVGARQSTIRRPFLWIGVKMGLLGGVLSVIFLSAMVYGAGITFGFSITIQNLYVYGAIAVGLILFGMLLSFFCNILAVYRYMNNGTDRLYA